MATHYSNHFTSDYLTTPTTVQAPWPRLQAGQSHGRMRKKAARIFFDVSENAFTATEICYVMNLKSNDAIYGIWGTHSATTALVIDLGLYTGANLLDGALIDEDLFCDGENVTSAATRTDWLLESTDIAATDRGLRLWELANLGDSAPGYTSDPVEMWSLVMTCMTTQTTSDWTGLIEVDYISGE